MCLTDISRHLEEPNVVIVPWYFPYPPWIFSCTPFCTSLSNILVLAGLSNPAILRMCVALIQSSDRLRMTWSPAILSS